MDSNDEYVDPDVAALRGQLEEMGKMVNDLRGQLSKQTGVIARQSLVSQMSELEQKYAPLGVWDQVKEAILKQESEWNQSPQGRALLADASFDTWDTVAAKAAFSNPDDLRSRLQAARTDTLRSMSTEGGHSIATTGREEPTPRHATVQEALEHMARTGKI